MNSRTKQVADILANSRYEVGKSQEYMAEYLNVSKKTIYNFEKGIKSPTFEQILLWYDALGLNPVSQIWKLAYPKQFNNKFIAKDTEIESAFNTMISELDINDKRSLLYVYYGSHGSSPKALLQLLLAHLHLPIKNRYKHALLILEDFKLEQKLNNLICKENIMPDIEILEAATNKGLSAVIKNDYGYIIKD